MPPHPSTVDAEFHSNAFATVPALFISRATLVYGGFAEEKASGLWTKWNDWPATGIRRETDPDDGGPSVAFVDFISGHLDGRIDAWAEDDDAWRACLDALSIAKET